MTSTEPSVRTPRWYNYWGWGSGDMLGAGAQAVITGWLFYFFTTFCALTPVQAGLIQGLPRLLHRARHAAPVREAHRRHHRIQR